VSGGARLILGIDPGIALLGYGLIATDSGQLHHITHGCIRTSSDLAEPQRLRRLYGELRTLRHSYPVTDVAMESLFYSRNVTTAMAVGQARGVALLATVDESVTFREYTPTQVKQSVAGFGAARKRQIQETIGLLLNLSALPAPDDAADALAIAVCHLRHIEFEKLIAASPSLKPVR